MGIQGWVLSKFDETPDDPKPLVASLSVLWHGTMMPETPDGWALVWLEDCDAAHYDLILNDPDIIWIGDEADEVPPEIITTYADHLDPAKTYTNLRQVLTKLGQWESRFLYKP